MRIHMQRHRRPTAVRLVPIAAAIALAFVLVKASPAAEIIPSLGLSKSVNGGDDARLYSGIAVRGALAPALKAEIGVAYHSESRFGDQLKVRSWPITTSLYLAPGPVYAGAGVGWYQTTFAYAEDSPFADETRQEFGVHVGGGLEIPLSPAAGLDLNGRYVMLREQQSRLVPEQFDPDFWSMSLGLAFNF